MRPRIFLAFFLIEAMCVDHERLDLKRRLRYLSEEIHSRVVQLNFITGGRWSK